MTTAERLTKVAENIPKVYEAGVNAGIAQADIEYEFEDVSFLDLQEQGSLTIDKIIDGIIDVTENMLSAEQALFEIDISGYVEFEGVASETSTPVYILVDGVKIYTNGDDWKNTKFSFKGKVKENITVYASCCTYTFNRFAIGKVIRKDYEKGVADGKQAEYDRFWDNYQANGRNTDYLYAFAGSVWKDTIYNPKYPIIPSSNGQYMYSYSTITDTKVPIDISGAANNLASMFSNTKLVTIRELIVSETTLTSSSKGLTNVFTGSNRLENITIVGVIATSIDVQWCTKLTAESLLSILTALTKDSAFANGKTATFATASQAVIEADAQCSEQYNLALAAGWQIRFE